MITIEQIKHRIDDIKQIVQDQESAHMKEDQLHLDVLEAISNGSLKTIGDIRTAASLAFSTSAIGYDRWYA